MDFGFLITGKRLGINKKSFRMGVIGVFRIFRGIGTVPESLGRVRFHSKELQIPIKNSHAIIIRLIRASLFKIRSHLVL